MTNALFNRGQNGNMSMHDMNCKWLRKKAYARCIENADYKKDFIEKLESLIEL